MKMTPMEIIAGNFGNGSSDILKALVPNHFLKKNLITYGYYKLN
jgi:hypothetical protein